MWETSSSSEKYFVISLSWLKVGRRILKVFYPPLRMRNGLVSSATKVNDLKMHLLISSMVSYKQRGQCLPCSPPLPTIRDISCSGWGKAKDISRKRCEYSWINIRSQITISTYNRLKNMFISCTCSSPNRCSLRKWSTMNVLLHYCYVKRFQLLPAVNSSIELVKLMLLRF